IRTEPGVHGGYDLWVDTRTIGLALVVESSQPRHASLTNLALPVVKDSICCSGDLLLVRLFGDLRDRVFTHVVFRPRHELMSLAKMLCRTLTKVNRERYEFRALQSLGKAHTLP